MAYKQFGYETVSWGLSLDYTSIDLLVPANQIIHFSNQLILLERLVNEAIQAAIPIQLIEYPKEVIISHLESASKIPTAVTDLTTVYDMNKLTIVDTLGTVTNDIIPLTYLRGQLNKSTLSTLEILRFVYITGIDLNACGK